MDLRLIRQQLRRPGAEEPEAPNENRKTATMMAGPVGQTKTHSEGLEPPHRAGNHFYATRRSSQGKGRNDRSRRWTIGHEASFNVRTTAPPLAADATSSARDGTIRMISIAGN